MSKKPYRLNCAALAARIKTINKMMSLFTGAAGNPPMQPVDVKNLFYQMMPGEWQRAFLNSGQVITNNNYTLLSLQHFMPDVTNNNNEWVINVLADKDALQVIVP